MLPSAPLIISRLFRKLNLMLKDMDYAHNGDLN